MGYYPYADDPAPYAESTATYDSGYSSSYGSATGDGTTSSSYQTVDAAETNTLAHLTVKLPADARLWFENTLTRSTGPVRHFHSPQLTGGHSYTYEVRAAWNENGHEVTQTQQVGVTAGGRVEVDFPVRPSTAGPTAAPNKR
jgi:uncharacterized protein (TIGR03000 family)